MAKLSGKEIQKLARTIVNENSGGIRYSTLVEKISPQTPETPRNTIVLFPPEWICCLANGAADKKTVALESHKRCVSHAKDTHSRLPSPETRCSVSGERVPIMLISRLSQFFLAI